MNIRTKLTFSFIAVSLVSIFLVSGIAFYFAKDALISSSKENLQTVVAHQKVFISQNIQTWKEKLSLITSRTKLRLVFSRHLESPSSQNILEMEQILNDVIEAAGSIKNIELCDLKGDSIVFIGATGLSNSSCEISLNEKTVRPEIKNAWMGEHDKLFALVQEPIYQKEKLIGLMVGLIDAKEIIEVVQNFSKIGETTELIISEKNPKGFDRAVTPLRFLNSSDFEDRKKTRGANSITDSELTIVSGNAGGDWVEDYRGYFVLTASAVIPEMNWTLIAKVDRNEVLEPIKSLLFIIGIFSVLAFILLMIIGVVISRTFTYPIMQLVNIAEKVQEGDLSLKFERTSQDEINYLGTTFNNMLESLNKKSKRLMEIEIYQRAVIDSMADGLITMDRYGKIESMSNSCSELFEYKPEEIIGLNVQSIIPDLEKLQNKQLTINDLVVESEKNNGLKRELKGKRKDKSCFPIELSICEVSIEERMIYCVIIRDMTYRSEAEREIREKEEQLRQTIKNAPIGIALIGLDGKYFHTNPTLCKIMGYREEELAQKGLEIFRNPEGLDVVSDILTNYESSSADSFEKEQQLRNKKGNIIWVLITVGVVREESGKPKYYIFEIMDITSRRKSEEERKAAKAFQDLVLESIPDLVFVKDEDLRIIQANQSFLEMYPEAKRDKVIGYTTLEEYEPEQVGQFTANDRAAFETGYNESEETITFPGGESKILLTKKVRFSSDGKSFLLGVSRDISEIKMTQRQLEQANKELEQFAYIASHDLKAPMRGIDNLANWIAEDLEEVMSEDTREKINLMRQRISRLEMLLKDILTYSRAGRILDEPEAIDTKALVEEVVDSLVLPAEFKVSIPDSMPTIFGVYTPLQQVFLNLISNAHSHHDRENGSIEIAFKEIGNTIEFSVKDDGPGISPQFQERVFQMFQTLQPRDTKESSGLGLSIVKKLVQWLECRVWIESKKESRGTKVNFTWPKVYKGTSSSHAKK